ncbi:MAG: ABC transporter permease [Clostridia bacterium]|nr:ABC transporter permease [Clostridia bacterium]
MGNLLKYETRKLFKAKSFYICLIVLAVYIFFTVLIEKTLYDAWSDEAPLFDLPTAAEILQSALSSGITTIILGIFAALFACEDYADGTIKNIYSKGYARVKVYFCKFITLCIFSFAACVISWLCGYIFGAIYFDSGTINGNTIASLIAQFVIVAGYTAMFFAISMVIRKTGGSIAACIVAPLLITLILSLIDSFFNLENFAFADYWLDGLLTSVSSADGKIALAIILPVIYGAVFTAIGILINRRQEV